MNRDIRHIVSQLTLEEKASLCSGLDAWRTQPIDRLGIPSIQVSDGPHGLRKPNNDANLMAVNQSVPATCFPSGASLANSWDRALIAEVGAALGAECQAQGVAILLGPAANIKRSPLCGRNFEYFSEDPYLSSELAASYIQGVQSQGVGTALKHFAANNQEHRRMTTSAVIDERTLREIYLASFEQAVKQSQPWTVMCSYNRVNGTYASENSRLLTEILKDEWGHEGFVMSDWGAVNERVDGLAAGLELEMPGGTGLGDQKIIQAVHNKVLPEATLDKAVERLLTVIFKAADAQKPNTTYDRDAHHALARKAARESMVLLKNEDAVLPLQRQGKIAVLGAFAQAPRYQGGGSSHVHPTQLDPILAEITAAAGANAVVSYAPGYRLDSDGVDDELISEAKRTAANADVALVFAGLPERSESEGYDRPDLRMPPSHDALITAVASVQRNTVVVLSNGAPVEMPWLDDAKAVLDCYLGGQAVGGAIADVVFGAASPSGKLAETFPVRLSHNPSFLNFPGEGDEVHYAEGLFVGYRYYDKKGLAPLFPFGHGLGYTTFEYSDLELDKREVDDTDSLSVRIQLKNVGHVTGKEVVQLYVRPLESTVTRPEQELKGFAKVKLQPGEQTAVTFTLDKRSFAYYDVDLADWCVETGAYEIRVGKSSRDIVLRETITVQSTWSRPNLPVHRNTTVGDLLANPVLAPVMRTLLDQNRDNTPLGAALADPESMAAITLKDMPLRALVHFSEGTFTDELLDALLAMLNSVK